MNNDEKKLLSVHRLRNWIRTFEQVGGDIERARAQLMELGHTAGYARLEALEEADRLLSMGMSQAEVRMMLTSMGVAGPVIEQVLGKTAAEARG
jgi:hypothetical protein